eukprot:5928499-Pleurochrysis_carterae.AAC.1
MPSNGPPTIVYHEFGNGAFAEGAICGEVSKFSGGSISMFESARSKSVVLGSYIGGVENNGAAVISRVCRLTG